MDEPIISREAIRAKARCAFADGAGRDEHGLNPVSAAVTEWQDEWDRQYAARPAAAAAIGRPGHRLATVAA